MIINDKKMHFGPYEVKLSHQDKVIFPKLKLTKADVLDYYLSVSNAILPWLKDRPLTLHRFPDGVEAKSFYQKNVADYFPEWLPRFKAKKENGETIHMPMIAKKADLAYLVNQGSIVFHTWLSKQNKPDKPDKIIFDLDPPENLSFGKVATAALRLKEFLIEQLNAAVFVMSTGSKGLHLHVPIKVHFTFDELKPFIKSLSESFSDEFAKDYTTEIRKDKRDGRIFIDYLRNTTAQTSVCPYALRAVENAAIAMPLAWETLKDNKFEPGKINIHNCAEQIKAQQNPWKDYTQHHKNLHSFIKK